MFNVDILYLDIEDLYIEKKVSLVAVDSISCVLWNFILLNFFFMWKESELSFTGILVQLTSVPLPKTLLFILQVISGQVCKGTRLHVQRSNSGHYISPIDSSYKIHELCNTKCKWLEGMMILLFPQMPPFCQVHGSIVSLPKSPHTRTHTHSH